jgi:large subunit ribosomal protein L9
VPIALHPEVEVSVSVIVARNEDEAGRIARGEDLTQLREPTEQEAAAIAAEAFFEPGAGEAAQSAESAEQPEAPPQDQSA